MWLGGWGTVLWLRNRTGLLKQLTQAAQEMNSEAMMEKGSPLAKQLD